MLVLSERLVGVPIMSLHSGSEVGTTARAVIDPGRLTIPAFYCEGPTIDFSPAILHTSDIREIGSIGIIVDSSDDIMPPDDLVRLQPILDLHFTLEEKTVVEENGRKLGKVVDYIVDTESFYILKLHVKPSLWQSFSIAELIIDRSQIKNITDDKIIVKQASVENEAIAPLPPNAINNPFRRPQAEATQPHRTKTES